MANEKSQVVSKVLCGAARQLNSPEREKNTEECQKKLSCRLVKGQEPQSHLGKLELPFLSCFRFHTLQRPLKWYPHAEANAFWDLRPHTMARSLNRHCCQNRHALLQRSHQHKKFRKNNCGVSNGNFKHGSD